MKKLRAILILALVTAMLLTTGCASQNAPTTASAPETSAPAVETTAAAKKQVASAEDMTTVEDVVEEGMVPIYADSLKDGVYPITVNCSSSMFKITECELTVENGKMTAVLHMSGTSYLKVFPGTGEEAVAASEEDYIPYAQTAEGVYTFTIPVEALDMGIPCAAYSKNKEMWYDRTLVFRADSLPVDAYQDGVFTTVESLGLEDGAYTVEVQLAGGSGKASVDSPAAIRVENGEAYATLVWSSSNYDYMRVNEEQFFPINAEGNSTFEIPVAMFDWKMPVFADTTAMSTPHEIAYTLYFDSTTLEKVE